MGMDIYGQNGNYFRANIWSWRAICYALDLAGFDVPASWGSNDGAGLTSPRECNQLADTLESFICAWDGDVLILECDRIRVSKAGVIVDPGTPGSLSPYQATREHLQEFVDFLRDCEGFAIR